MEPSEGTLHEDGMEAISMSRKVRRGSNSHKNVTTSARRKPNPGNVGRLHPMATRGHSSRRR
jgi:hypothetical protein